MNEAALRMALRLTARTTFVFFLCAFTANALRDLWPGKFSIWLAARRDWLLLAVAASHTFHLIAIIAFFHVVGWSRLKLPTVVGGGMVYLLIYALAVAAILRLQGRKPGLLGLPKFEAIALYLIWLIFALAFVPRIVSGWPVYSFFEVAALSAFLIRIACLVRYRRAKASAVHAVR
jgi:methionine sulfoxide reductase heme-binding subunit